jgi:hypothetical protein
MKPRQFRLRTLLILVAIASLISLVASNPYRHGGITDKRVVIPVASIIAAFYGVASMRRPLLLLWPLVVVWVVTPRVDHPTPDVVNGSILGCLLAWIIGAPAGWISRSLRTGAVGAQSLSRSRGPEKAGDSPADDFSPALADPAQQGPKDKLRLARTSWQGRDASG